MLLLKKRYVIKIGQWGGIFSWFVIGAVLILAAVFTAMTLQNLNKQKEQTTRLLTEKGEALIRSFEAGARTGAGMQWSAFQLQKLLIEMAQQPGIDYIIVINTSGVILADSDPSRVGEIYGTDLDLPSVSKAKKIAWRQVPNTVGADTFEVYGQFAPTQEPFDGFRDIAKSKTDKGFVIFVGLDMGPILTVRKADEQNTIWVAIILLLIGCFGVVSLFLAYRYRATQASLSRIQAFSDHLVENMPIGLVAINGDGKVATFNSTAAAILGLSVGESLGQPAEQVIPALYRDIESSLRADAKFIDREVDYPVREGKVVPLEVIASNLEQAGKILGVIVLFRDLTEIQFLKKEVVRSQRLAALGNLAAGIAHEIRNPLSSIKGFATYFKERYRNIPEDKQTAEIMINEVERLNRVISELLEFARPLNLVRKPTSLAFLLRHTLKMIEEDSARKGITLETDDIMDAFLDIDPDKIKQVFLNLFLNALASMDKGGNLRVKVAPDRDNRYMRISISDTGQGIEKEDLKKIFDPYFTTKPSGTGLGLAIVHKIMEAHNGDIRVDSVPGGGTTVTLLLPLVIPNTFPAEERETISRGVDNNER